MSPLSYRAASRERINSSRVRKRSRDGLQPLLREVRKDQTRCSLASGYALGFFAGFPRSRSGADRAPVCETRGSVSFFRSLTARSFATTGGLYPSGSR